MGLRRPARRHADHPRRRDLPAGTDATAAPALPPGAHLAARLRLFLIIALGEVVLTTGVAISESPTEPGTLLAGLVATAVGCETVIAHPFGEGSLAVGLLLGGGSLLYVATQTWYLHVTTRNRLGRRWGACAILAGAIPTAAVLPPLLTLGLVAMTLAALAAYAPRHRYTP